MKRDYNKILGTLTLNPNTSCSEHITIHPIRSDDWYLIPHNLSEEEAKQHKSILHFDTRHKWDAYYYKFADCEGWVVERKELYLRMRKKDFERFFGKYEVKEN